MCRDASLSVWDLRACACCVQTSLSQHCMLADIEMLDLKPTTGEPYVKLRGGRVLLFHKGLGSWLALSCLQLEPAEPSSKSQEGPGCGPNASARRRPADAVRVESDILVAACLGDADLFREHLEALCWFFLGEDLAALRGWLAAVLNVTLGAARPWPLLTAELHKLQLDTRELLQEVILPVLRSTPAAEGLRRELEDAVSGTAGRPIL